MAKPENISKLKTENKFKIKQPKNSNPNLVFDTNLFTNLHY